MSLQLSMLVGTKRPAPFVRVFIGKWVVFCGTCRVRHDFDFFADAGTGPLAVRHVRAFLGVYPFSKCKMEDERALVVALRRS